MSLTHSSAWAFFETVHLSQRLDRVLLLVEGRDVLRISNFPLFDQLLVGHRQQILALNKNIPSGRVCQAGDAAQEG